jgi:tRNA pseudouridine38-40 synthase
MRFKLTIEYAGTRYSGWQIQANARTIQGELQRAVSTVTGRGDFELYGSGRTDAGVHALGQVAHLDTASAPPADVLCQRLNEALPSDIAVLSAERVRHRFHARHDAVARSYLYQVSRRKTAFAKPFVWWVKEPLALEGMRLAARQLVGFHDFRSFSDDDPSEKSTEVALDCVNVHEDEDLLLVHVEGSHFIWKMVRRIVGVLVAAGRGELSEAEVRGLLAGPTRTPARLTAPASGLFLERVYYPGDSRDGGLRSASVVRAAALAGRGG